MKVSMFTRALLIAPILFLTNCRKDLSKPSTENLVTSDAVVSSHKIHPRPLKASMDVYHIYTPDLANGGCYCFPYLPGYMAGEGEGNSTLLGKFYNYSNLYAYYDENGVEITNSVQITDNYYDNLKPYFSKDEIQAINEQKVEVLFFDHQGNAFWSNFDTLYMVASPENLLHFSVAGTGKIKGGIGKFTGATGSYAFSGYSDVFRDSAPGIFYQHSWFHMVGVIEY
ncbi:MAG: hypothetical protein ACTHK8_15050 [Ginsengibacter sp.]|jgi:hypothetical protein